MKKFTKLFLSCAAITAVTAAVATSAMAADITGDFTGTYDEATKKVTITSDVTPAEGTQVTFLVFEGEKDVTVDANTIKGIDQGTTIQPANDGLKSDVVTEEGKKKVYTVMLGYDDGTGFKPYSASFTLSGAAGDETEITIGDVDFGGSVNAMDATMIARKATGSTATTGHVGEVYATSDSNFDVTQVIIGDVDLGGSVNAMDATMIARKATGSTATTGHVGETIMIGDEITE